MNYKKIYEKLIERCVKRSYGKNDGDYLERHHIIPRCLNRSDDDNNLVYLTGREHYIAHLLLSKIHNTYELLMAVRMMRVGNGRTTGCMYERRSKEASRLHSARVSGENSPHHKGWIHTPSGIFPTYKSACCANSTTDMTIRRRCHSKSKRWSEWYIVLHDGKVIGVPSDPVTQVAENNNMFSGWYHVPGFERFSTLDDAERTTGIKKYTIRYRCKKAKGAKWDDWFFEDKEKAP